MRGVEEDEPGHVRLFGLEVRGEQRPPEQIGRNQVLTGGGFCGFVVQSGAATDAAGAADVTLEQQVALRLGQATPDAVGLADL